ncbi:MAG: hypothetical protein WD423_10590 [Rhodothermales bacterium]
MQDRDATGPPLDWLTVAAIAAVAISLTVAFHEGVHATACAGVGGELREFSALHVVCNHVSDWQRNVEAGSASIANLLLGTIFWFVLSRGRSGSSELKFFFWLFMLMNWLYGAGYWMFSGAANIGDWSVVIRGLEPHWLWRSAMFLVGSLLFLYFVWQALRELGKFIGGEAEDQLPRARKLGSISYVTSLGVVVLAGFFHPSGFLSLPVVAGLFAVAGALSPLLWMSEWFQARMFEKERNPPLEIRRRWGVISISVLVTLAYAVLLGQTLFF